MNPAPPNRRRLVLILSHLAALALGLALFRNPSASGAAGTDSPAAKAATANAQAAAETPELPSSRPRTRNESPTKPSVHLVAWKALASEGLSRPDRMKASATILQGWIKEDWQAALNTVMKETPDDFALLSEFSESFSREPVAVWSLIEEKRYGVLTKSLLDQWKTALAKRNEASLRQLAANLPEAGKQAALELIARKATK